MKTVDSPLRKGDMSVFAECPKCKALAVIMNSLFDADNLCTSYYLECEVCGKHTCVDFDGHRESYHHENEEEDDQ